MRPEKDFLTARGAKRHPVDDSEYPRVNKGHIVPKCHQRNFASGEQVMWHSIDGSTKSTLRNIESVCRLGPFYRRERPDGSHVDDVEHMLSRIEDKAGAPFKRIREKKVVEADDKAALADFFGFQLARTPAFYRTRSGLVEELVSNLPPEEFRQEALDELGSEEVRNAVIAHYTGSTPAHSHMVDMARNFAAALAAMQWCVLRFEEPLLVYSDRPVVVWPGGTSFAASLGDARSPILDAVEVRIPLSSHLMLLLSWADRPDLDHFNCDTMPTPNRRLIAGQFNQLTIAQADSEWAHHPDAKPPRGSGRALQPIAPHLLGAMFDYDYNPAKIRESKRRRRFEAQLNRNGAATVLQTSAVIAAASREQTKVPANPRPVRKRRK